MSTENRVEGNLSALVARRSFRNPIDNTGMGFQEELLSLTFESQTEFADIAVESQNSSSSVDQNQKNADDSTSANDEENERLDNENQDFSFPLPLPQLPINNSQPKGRKDELGSENPRGPELVKGSPSVDNAKVGTEQTSPSFRTQSNDLGRKQFTTNPRSQSHEQGNQKTSATVENPLESPEVATASDQAELDQALTPGVDAGQAIDGDVFQIQRESKKSSKNIASDTNRGGSVQENGTREAYKVADDRLSRIDQTTNSQDSLPYEQDETPTRARRTSRQDRIREENDGGAKRDSVESKQPKERESGIPSTVESSGLNRDSGVPSNQPDGIVFQSPNAGAGEINYAVTGQAVAGQTETYVVSGASNASAATASVTAGIAGGSEKLGVAESGSIQPLVAGFSRSESTTSSSRGTGHTEGSSGSSSLSRFQQNKLVQRVLKGLEQLSSGGGQVKLRLHPPELGTLQMTLKIEANVMSAHLEVENSLAKDALLNNLQGLRDRLGEQGMSIDRFEVEVRTDSQSGTSGYSGESESNRQSRRDQPESRYAIYNENRITSDTTDEGKRSVSWFRTTGQLDLSV